MNGRILLVGVDGATRDAVAAALAQDGHDLAEVADASGAVATMDNEPVDVVILGAHATDESGASLAAHAGVPVIALARDVDGAFDVVGLPVDPDAVRRRVRAALRLAATMHELRAARAQLRDIERTDHLTGLANRRHLDEHIAMAASATRRHRQPLALLLVDVDHFRRVNEELGRAAGDEVLRVVSARLVRLLRGEDMAGRWGGEELLVVAPTTDIDGAWRLGERIRDAVTATPIPLPGGRDVLVTVSVGCATGDGDDDHLHRVEAAMRAAKTAGRNRVCTDATVVS